VAEHTQMSIEMIEFKSVNEDFGFKEKTTDLVLLAKRNFPLLGKILSD